MKPPLFHVGQAVVRITPVNRYPGHDDVPLLGIGTIYHVQEVRHMASYGFDLYAIFLCEVGCTYGYTEDGFAPVEEMPAETYAELLEALEPVTA